MSVVVLVSDGYRQGAGNSFGGMATVTHDNRNVKLLLVLSIKHPQSCQRRCPIEVVLQVEVVGVAIFRWDSKMEGWAVLWGVLVHGLEES